SPSQHAPGQARLLNAPSGPRSRPDSKLRRDVRISGVPAVPLKLRPGGVGEPGVVRVGRHVRDDGVDRVARGDVERAVAIQRWGCRNFRWRSHAPGDISNRIHCAYAIATTD